MPLELIPPWNVISIWVRNPLFTLVWTQRTPWLEETKRRFGIESIAVASYTRPDVLTIIRPDDVKMYETFVSEHFGDRVVFEERRNVRDRYVLGQFYDGQKRSASHNVPQTR